MVTSTSEAPKNAKSSSTDHAVTYPYFFHRDGQKQPPSHEYNAKSLIKEKHYKTLAVFANSGHDASHQDLRLQVVKTPGVATSI